MSILVLADHDGDTLKSTTLNAVAAAARIGGDIHVLVAGQSPGPIAHQAAAITGTAKVLVADSALYAHGLAEPLAALLAALAPHYTHVVAATTTTGKNVLPRLAAVLDVAPVSDVTEVIAPDTFVRPIYAGNALATVRSRDALKVLTIRATAFAAAGLEGAAAIEEVAVTGDPGLSAFVALARSKSDRPDLATAPVVVSGGRGLQSAENFKLIEALADTLGGAVGASRAAVDAGYAANDMQVGQTGKIVAPGLYIAVGISGAIQHLAGMKDSKVIVAINKDPDAPIFQIADYGLETDLFTALPALTQALAKA